jgi:competence protein ComEC
MTHSANLVHRVRQSSNSRLFSRSEGASVGGGQSVHSLKFIRGGKPNPACNSVAKKDESAYTDPDNGESAGFVLTYGRFRTIDLGDLTWDGELDLMCPTNRIGTVDLYLTSHHGLAKSGAPALVHALQPRVAVMNNGTRKGGEPDSFRVLFASPGLEAIWQLHWSYNVGLENSPATFVANVEDNATIAGVLVPPQPAGPRGGGFGGAAHSPLI